MELRIPGFDEYRGDPRFLADRIYVLGQSENRIAYFIEPADEACCYQPEIIVQDLVDDSIAWKDSYNSDRKRALDRPPLANLEQLWRARGTDWERHLREQGISREAPPVLHEVPTGGTAVPRFEVHTEEVDDTSPEGYAHLTSYRIDLVTASATTTIARSSSRETNLEDVEALGFVQSNGPEGLGAVLVLEIRRGWEGPPSVHRLHFVGANIEVGPR